MTDELFRTAAERLYPNVKSASEHLRHRIESLLTSTGLRCQVCIDSLERAKKFEEEHPNYCDECGRWDE